jgi:uncharacterized protein
LAIKWYTMAANQGVPEAQCNLGHIYQFEKNDFASALKWYRKSADNGFADAQYCIGNMYENGFGVSKDSNEACKWYRKAADQGHSESKEHLNRLTDIK